MGLVSLVGLVSRGPLWGFCAADQLLGSSKTVRQYVTHDKFMENRFGASWVGRADLVAAVVWPGAAWRTSEAQISAADAPIRAAMGRGNINSAAPTRGVQKPRKLSMGADMDAPSALVQRPRGR